MNGLKHMLTEEKKRLEKIIRQAKQGLQSAPEGYLRISKGKKKPRYYHCMEDVRSGAYISNKNVELPGLLAQKTYNHQVMKKAEVRLKQITKILEDYSDSEIEELYTSLSEERRKLITPVEPLWEQVVQQWLQQPYLGKQFQENMPVILTNKGMRVRSKSEKTIADYFDQHGIPYKYECPLYLEGYGIIYPDFTIMSAKNGKVIYWEHFGRMDDPGYARKTVKKIDLYEKNGLFQGVRLIMTYETEHSVLNVRTIERLVKQYLQ